MFVNSLRRTGARLADLTEEQVKRIEGLRVKIKMEEEKVGRQQVGVADRRMVEVMGGGGGGDEGVVGWVGKSDENGGFCDLIGSSYPV
ncbi:hypothetical protein L6452_43527 [Arctium lappa]|uniref:Uncharacterized protein n=1 Tax=Arctium lappa TaxID=4217 RepID=A0ACB8XH03_ARCLA|nr:hypothetical protein L6452_43527 [Arctium lappa]